MIKRIYINNFRTLVNFELELDQLTLLMGPNGSGKSSVLDVLHKLKRFVVEGDLVKRVFPHSEFTRWQEHMVPEQSFELDIDGSDGLFRYRLVIEYDEHSPKVKEEILTLDGKPLFEFKDGDADIYKGDFTKELVLSLDGARSGMTYVTQRSNKKAMEFEQRLASTLVVRPNPVLMETESREEDEYPQPDLSNFASWYLTLLLEQPGLTHKLSDDLKKIMDGFDSLRLEKMGEARVLLAKFSDPSGKLHPYKLHELSDGQRMLIALYTLLHCGTGENSMLCIDEPENFLALPEIQLWLDAVHDRMEETDGQFLMISHHPRIINWLSLEHGIWLYRDGNGHTRVKEIGPENDTGLPISQLVERGWIVDV